LAVPLLRRSRQNGPRQGSPGAEEVLMDTLEAHGADKLRQEYLERARELRPMLAAAGDEIERRREVTPEIVDALIERGIFRMLLPKSLGGARSRHPRRRASAAIRARVQDTPAAAYRRRAPPACPSAFPPRPATSLAAAHSGGNGPAGEQPRTHASAL
jgi:alkylation response protein AidB-like acyl-CoA dehydrogenase